LGITRGLLNQIEAEEQFLENKAKGATEFTYNGNPLKPEQLMAYYLKKIKKATSCDHMVVQIDADAPYSEKLAIIQSA